MAVFDLDRDGGSLMVFPLCAELLIRVQGYPGVKYWLWCLVQYSGGRGGEGGNTVSICQTVMLLACCSGAGLGHVKQGLLRSIREGVILSRSGTSGGGREMVWGGGEKNSVIIIIHTDTEVLVVHSEVLSQPYSH